MTRDIPERLPSPALPQDQHRRGAFRAELRSCLRLGAPLAAGELGWMSTYIVDALMIGRLPHSALPIAASGIGNTVYYGIVFFAIYLLNGLETIVSQAAGRGDRDECVRITTQSMWIVLFGTPAVMLLTTAVMHALPMFGVSLELTAETQRYTRVLIWSTLPLMLYMALRRFLQSINRVALISVSLITAGGMNWLCDWLFVFGHMHAPALGLVGSAVATGVVRCWMLAILVVGSLIALRDIRIWPTLAMLRPDAARLKALLHIGWPSGLEFSLELAISTFTTLLCARLGTEYVAAQQVALDLNAFVYMVPTGMAYAAMIRAGQAAGRNNLGWVQRAVNATLTLTLGYAAFASAIFLAFPHRLAGMYTNDVHVVSMAAPLFYLCALLIPADTLFVIQASALTGLGDTRTPLWVSLVCNWVIGMPAAYWLAFPMGYKVTGLWVGRAIASVSSGVVLTYFWRRRMRRESHSDRPSLAVPLLTPLSAR